MDFDYIIVGGGSAGCVLANRLSANPKNRVLLCEAGPDVLPNAVPPELADSYAGAVYANPKYHWTGLNATTEWTSHNQGPDAPPPRQRKYIQGRVLGGGSSINAQMVNRGAPADYDEWERLGAAGWGWDAVLPYFKKVESDQDFDGAFHGKNGPIPIRRVPRELWNGFSEAAAKSFADAGFEYIDDQNGEFRDGHYPIAINNVDEARVSAAVGYLTNEVRARDNLKILTGSPVRRLVFDGRRCTGIDILVKGAPQEMRAHEVIVTSGAIYSPALLLRSGVGPAAHLRELGIKVVADRAGVGQRLMDHPSVAVGTFVRRQARWNGRTRRHALVGLRYSSGIGEAPTDMVLFAMAKTAWHDVGNQIAALAVMVGKTDSERGEVMLKSKDWRVDPQVDFNLLADPRDVERLMDGYRRAIAMHASPALQAVTREAFPASYSERLLQYGVVNGKNRAHMRFVRMLLDGPAPLRRLIIKKGIVDKYGAADLLADDAALETFVRKSAIGAYHASCSCRMGAEDDAMAVVDPVGRVYGTGGLRIADSSVFPKVPRANTNLPAMMVAEKIADAILN